MKKILGIASVLLAFVLGAGSAVAAPTTYDFRYWETNSGGPFTLGCYTGGLLNVGCNVTYNFAGVGINGRPDTQPGAIDSFPIPSFEALEIKFTQPFTLLSLQLGQFDFGDEFEYSIDGGAFSGPIYTSGLGASILGVAGTTISKIVIRASSVLWEEILTDSFTLRSFTGTVAAVPVPAGVVLGASGLAILGFLGRRKRKSAAA